MFKTKNWKRNKQRNRRFSKLSNRNKKEEVGRKVGIGFWNVQCLTGVERQESVHNLLESKGLDVLCLAETWFRQVGKVAVSSSENVYILAFVGLKVSWI